MRKSIKKNVTIFQSAGLLSVADNREEKTVRTELRGWKIDPLLILMRKSLLINQTG